MRNLVDSLIKSGILHSKNTIEAFRTIDRKDFVLPEFVSEAHHDYALPLGFGQTISQPLVVAFMLELLKPRRGDKILDVGSGSGWTTGLLAYIVGEKGRVLGLEIIPELVSFGRKNLEKYNFRNAEINLAGAKLGLKEQAPYDRILVSASGDELPRELWEQLKPGGIMVIPIGWAIWQVKKTKKDIPEIKKFEGFVFVPLINPHT